MKANTKTYSVVCAYDAHRYLSDENKNFELDIKIENLLPKKCDGTGCGFGKRDIFFYDMTRKEADRLVARARKIKGVTAIIRVQN